MSQSALLSQCLKGSKHGMCMQRWCRSASNFSRIRMRSWPNNSRPWQRGLNFPALRALKRASFQDQHTHRQLYLRRSISLFGFRRCSMAVGLNSSAWGAGTIHASELRSYLDTCNLGTHYDPNDPSANPPAYPHSDPEHNDSNFSPISCTHCCSHAPAHHTVD